jgi:two-component system LytT family response regulator
VGATDLPTKIRTIIVDDEPLARSNLSVLLRRDPEIEILGECSSGEEAVGKIRTAAPDLLFLDVQMPEYDGFDVLEMLGTDLPSAIVFVTAYDQYAIRAFETGALDYLLKPFDDNRFERALDRAKQAVRRSKISPKKVQRFAIRGLGQIAFVRVPEIDWIEAADYYACLHVGPRTHLLRRSLAELEQELDTAAFCRIHRSTIVNLARVQKMQIGADGEYEVVLSDGTSLRLSRRHSKDFQTRLGTRA